MSDLIKLSVSKSATFQNCKKKYQFSYIYKLPKKEYTYHTFGRFVHRILELFHLAYINGSEGSYTDVMSESFNESMVEFKGKITQEAKKEAYEIIKIYLKRLEEYPSEVSKVISVEQVFNIQIDESLILTGMIDRVQYDEDGVYHVLDYKTSKSKKYLKDDTLQLLTYAYVLYTEHPELKKVRVSYIMLKLGCEFLTKEFNLDEILTIKDIYEKYARDIRNETEFPPTPQVLCSWCDFNNVCESYAATNKKQFAHGKTSWNEKIGYSK